MHLGNNSCSIDKLLVTLCRQGTRLFSGPELKSGGIKERVSRVKNLGGSYIIMNSRVTWYRDLCRKAPVVPLWHARYARTRIYRQSIECTGACQFGRLSSSLLLDFIPLSVKLKKKRKREEILFPWPAGWARFFPILLSFPSEKKENIKIKVFIYGLPAGGDSLTSQSLARRKCLLMGRLSGPVPIGIHLSFSTDLANSFLLGMHLPSCFSPSSIARPLCWPSCPSKVLLTRLHYWQAQDSAGGPWWARSADFHSVPLFLLLFIVSNSIFHVYLLREWEMIYSVPRH